MWDLGIPQESVTILYKDNDCTTAMAHAGKPALLSRHIDIKFYVLQEWVEQYLIVLQKIDTSLDMADHYTKLLPCLLFYRHNDYNMGCVPPSYSPKYDHNVQACSVPGNNKSMIHIVNHSTCRKDFSPLGFSYLLYKWFYIFKMAQNTTVSLTIYHLLFISNEPQRPDKRLFCL
eukprot:CCRYP_007301-RB/>CCRYP_007301-RB protein AED:0.63 eAED:0.42 QI:0/-1/0/1/-1/0/1/0/173